MPNPRPPSHPGMAPEWAKVPGCPRLERYALGRELGRGGMGRVVEAWDPVLKRVVAIKLLHGSDPELMVRFMREAQLQARLEHPNICRILDMGECEGTPYIAMQRIDGPDLADPGRDLDPLAVARILADVAGAIHFAHRTGLIHRDLKPSNILVEAMADGSWHPYVVDFGLARDLQGNNPTLSWAAMGTPAYMSPEQARCEAVTFASDVYSLGATLFALVTGRPPGDPTTRGITASRRRDTTGPRRTWPRDLETIARKCLEDEPGRRYASAFELEEDLRRFLAGMPIHARPVGFLGRTWRWFRQSPARTGTAAAILLAAGLLGAWNVHTLRQARERENTAQRFALEIRDAEHLLRIERMMPRHDIQGAEARLRARMSLIQQEMARRGSTAQGPGHYALGRGLLSLGEYPAALAELDKAWQSGFQAPEVAYGIGLAQLKIFEDRRYGLLGKADSVAELGRLHRELVDPALAWMKRARGAAVDHPCYGEALAAWASGRFEEADRLFQATLDDAPWLSEVLVSRARCMVMRPAPSTQATPGHLLSLMAAAEPFLDQAERIAPSDPTPLHIHASFYLSRAILINSRGSRTADPVHRAQSLLRQAMEIRPDDADLATVASAAVLQLAFLDLSTGRDPGSMVREQARILEGFLDGRKQISEGNLKQLPGNLHNLWWVVLEADARFGRDTTEALAQTAHWRGQVPLDVHMAFPLLVEAKLRRARGKDAGPVYVQTQGILEQVLASQGQPQEVFLLTTLGQCLFERAEWEAFQGRDPGPTLLRSIQILERAVRTDPTLAFIYYYLPRAQALLARTRAKTGGDPAPLLEAALANAATGLAINPRNAHLQLTAADVYLARAQAGPGDPGPWLDRARGALDLSEAVNPRYYEAKLLRAEVELEAALAAKRSGQPLGPFPARVIDACRQGRAIMKDEPGFARILARVAALGAETQGDRTLLRVDAQR